MGGAMGAEATGAAFGMTGTALGIAGAATGASAGVTVAVGAAAGAPSPLLALALANTCFKYSLGSVILTDF